MRMASIVAVFAAFVGACRVKNNFQDHRDTSTVVWEYASGAGWVEYRGLQYRPSHDELLRKWDDDWPGPLLIADSGVRRLAWVSVCAERSTQQAPQVLQPSYVAMIPWYVALIDNDMSTDADMYYRVLSVIVGYAPWTAREQEQAAVLKSGRIGEWYGYMYQIAGPAFLRAWQFASCGHVRDGSTYREKVTYEFDGSKHHLTGYMHLGKLVGSGVVTWSGRYIPYQQWETGRLAALSCAWLNSNAPDMHPDAGADTSPSQRVAVEAKRSQIALVNIALENGIPMRAGYVVDISTNWDPGTSSTPAHGRAEGSFLTVLDALRLNGGWSCDAREGKEPYFFTVLR